MTGHSSGEWLGVQNDAELAVRPLLNTIPKSYNLRFDNLGEIAKLTNVLKFA